MIDVQFLSDKNPNRINKMQNHSRKLFRLNNGEATVEFSSINPSEKTLLLLASTLPQVLGHFFCGLLFPRCTNTEVINLHQTNLPLDLPVFINQCDGQLKSTSVFAPWPYKSLAFSQDFHPSVNILSFKTSFLSAWRWVQGGGHSTAADGSGWTLSSTLLLFDSPHSTDCRY